MIKMRNSLTFRASLLSIFWIAMALLFTALLLRYLYRDHISSHFDAHAFMHVEELVGAVKISPDGDISLTRLPTDPQFHRLNSGWYWEVRYGRKSLYKSASLGEFQLDLENLDIHENNDVKSLIGPSQQKLRAHMMETNFHDLLKPLLLVVTSPEMQISDDVEHYSWHILTSFLVLGAGLSLAVALQVKVALRPLHEIKAAISDVQAGRIKRLPHEFPSEVQPLVNELNHLLDHDERLVKRARTQLGDLAHAVKNPLTIIRNEARHMPNAKGQLILDQTHIMSSSIDHYLSLARSFGRNPLGLRTAVKPLIEDLRYVVEHVYAERNIKISLSGLEDCWFRGESQDLEEMAGNLMDNACKWAKSRVDISGQMAEGSLLLTVEDDGPGIPENKLNAVLTRGRRLDDATPGTGQGLGIVKDILDLYGGKLALGRSSWGGLKASLRFPDQ